MKYFSDQPENTTWAHLGVSEDFWLGALIQKLVEGGMPIVTAAHAVLDHESAALSAYHNGLAITLSVRRIQELVK